MFALSNLYALAQTSNVVLEPSEEGDLHEILVYRAERGEHRLLGRVWLLAGEPEEGWWAWTPAPHSWPHQILWDASDLIERWQPTTARPKATPDPAMAAPAEPGAAEHGEAAVRSIKIVAG